MLSIFFLSELVLIYSSKLRKWMGPSLYTQGSPPTPLDSFGFSSVGGKFYAFGGWDNDNGSNYRITTFTKYLVLLSKWFPFGLNFIVIWHIYSHHGQAI